MENFPKMKFNHKEYSNSFNEIFAMEYNGKKLTSIANNILYLDRTSALKVFDYFYIPFNTQLIANFQSLNIVLWSKDVAKADMIRCLKRIMITIIFMLADCFSMEI